MRILISKIMLNPSIKRNQLEKLVDDFVNYYSPGYEFEGLKDEEIEGGISNL
jgi:hypothetical protein